eukprot:GAHX01003497.1.p1 GENE.GAHX01003497.1~~GAHX01003497.1.p1  ORF type:complete len:280 (+),score=51.62 GAHX01003497.1:73-912(+)
MKPYRRHTISDKVRPKNKSRAAKEFGIAFILAFICGTVLAIVLYKYAPLDDSEPTKGTSSETDKDNILQLNENDNSAPSDQNKPNDNEDTKIDIDIVNIQNLDEQMTFDKFETIYNEYYSRIDTNDPDELSIIHHKVFMMNSNITKPFNRASMLYKKLGSSDDTFKFKNEKTILLLFSITHVALDFLKKYTKQGLGAFGKLDENKRSECMDTYINYLAVNIFMEYILCILTKELKDNGKTIVYTFNKRYEKDGEMNKFAIKNYMMLKQIKEGMFKTLKQ